MIIALKVLCILLFTSVSLLLAYNLFLAVVSLFRTANPAPPAAEAVRFVLVIPAHDEAETIGPTLDACESLDYPHNLYEIVVVADNCSDDTVGVVRGRKIRCLERVDPDLRGKGYALRWAFDQLLEEDHAVFVVLDADCSLPPHALRMVANEVSGGEKVLQASYVADNPDSTPISYAVALGNTIENDLYYRPKSAIGWMVALRGTGMFLKREVLETFPWGAYSIVEDLDYSMTLYAGGMKVKFLPGVEVRSAFPESLEQLRVQRGRWAGGNMQMGKSAAVKFLGTWIRERQAIYLDMAITILSQSRPLQLGQLLLLIVVAILGRLMSGTGFFDLVLTASLFLVTGYLLYVAWGVLRLGLNPRRIGLLARTPWIILTLTLITLNGLLGRTATSWERTPRG